MTTLEASSKHLFDLLDALVFLARIEICAQDVPYLVEVFEIIEALDEALY